MNANTPKRIAVVTGANRGLGLETGRQLARAGLRVYLTSREGLSGKAAADKLESEGLDVAYYPHDVTRPESARRLADHITADAGRLDVLVNNAGIFPEITRVDGPASILDLDPAVLRAHLDTNAIGALQTTQALLPLMRRNDYGRIVFVTSGYGRLSRMGAGYPAYRISKAAMNAVMRIVAAELAGENILANAVDPGWTSTRMGGDKAPNKPAAAAQWIVEAALLPEDGHRGMLLHHGEPVSW